MNQETANLTIRDAVMHGCILEVTTPTGRVERYKFHHAEANGAYREAWFVSLHDGKRWNYLGILDTFTSEVRCTAKSCVGVGHYAHTLISRILSRIWCNDEAAYTRHGYSVEALEENAVIA